MKQQADFLCTMPAVFLLFFVPLVVRPEHYKEWPTCLLGVEGKTLHAMRKKSVPILRAGILVTTSHYKNGYVVLCLFVADLAEI